jgi:hypothetical protein
MKKLTIEEKAKAYDKVSKEVKDFFEGKQKMYSNVEQTLEYLFPELAKSKDENMKNWILDELRLSYQYADGDSDRCEKLLKAIAWLEKQAEQKPIDKVKPKFHIGDTMRTLQEASNGITDGMPVVVSIDNEYYHCTNELIAIKDQDDYEFPPMNMKQNLADKVEPKFNVGDWITNKFRDICLITDIDLENSYYICESNRFDNTDGDIDLTDKAFHLWSIQDAKPGDVLTDGKKLIVIFKQFDESAYAYRQHIIAYIGLDIGGDIQVTDDTWIFKEIKPATQKQRELLFSKMKEEGYAWDKVNKKLTKKNEIKIGKTTMTKKEAIVKIKAWDFLDNDEKEILETLIPELKESEDEKIRKELIEHIKANKDADYVLFKKFSPDDVIAWLEKQGEQMTVLDELEMTLSVSEDDYLRSNIEKLIKELKRRNNNESKN